MRKPIIYLSLFGVLAIVGLYANHKLSFSDKQPTSTSKERNHQIAPKVQNGDLIFQTSLSDQSRAIQLATHSPYSHCGIIFQDNDRFYVFEAVQPVKFTPLDQWIDRGKNDHYVIKRLKNAGEILTSKVLTGMKRQGEAMEGKNYDLAFGWSDDQIYCSELIWKIYQRTTGLELGNLQRLSDFDLSDQRVKSKLKERYGSTIPMNETVISPAAIYNCHLLITVMMD